MRGKMHFYKKPAGEKRNLCIWNSKQARAAANSPQIQKLWKLQENLNEKCRKVNF